MDTHIDWLSFSLPCSVLIANVSDLYHISKGLLNHLGKEWSNYVYDGTGFDQAAGRPPFRYALGRNDGGIHIFGGGHLESILYEISGRACEGIRSYEDASRFVSPLIEQISRLDVAVDIRSNTRPTAFANDRSHNGFRSITFIRSDTGETVYVGSPKSDRFCRVYRYNPPHPRSETYRVEFVFRRGLAKAATRNLLDAGNFERFVAAAGATWGWQHSDWQPGILTDERLRVPVVTRMNEDTVRWLYTQVAPALRRLVKEEALDLTDWLKFVLEQDEID